MKKSLLILLLLTCQSSLGVFAQDNFEIIKLRVFNDVAKETKKQTVNATQNLTSIKDDGSWADIDYTSTTVTIWQPATHLDRLTNMLSAYTNAKSALYNNENLHKAIVNGLKFWYHADPKSSNWWHNEISVPQKLGALLIIESYGKDKISAGLKSDLINRMKRGAPDEKTGANKTDIALHYFYRALLTNDVTLLNFAVDQLFLPVKLVDGEEGLQYDYSYLQHGPQLYIAGYGEVYITGVLQLANYVKDTPYALSAEKLELFSKFYRETFLRTTRGNYIDFSVHGRGISRKDILKKSEISNLKELKKIDPKHQEDWDVAIRRFSDSTAKVAEIKPFHQYFWKADYTLHVRPNYLFTVRTNSERTKRTEAGNNENMYGRYLPDGATNIQVNGSEYYNIMPIWEWDKIPGTTSRDYSHDRIMTKFWGETGFNSFAGGVSDGVYGATAYQLKYDSVSAKKAWFLFDDEIVCLGAGINSNTTENITTTLNQSWLNGAVNIANLKDVSADDSIVIGNKKASWLYHANTGYYFPKPTEISLTTKRQTGNWYKINNSFSKDEVSGDVFKLWINHGVKPVDAKYEYLVLPGIKSKAGIENYDPKLITTIANTTAYQAVYHNGLKILQAVFYTASSLESKDFKLSVNHPCILMIKKNHDGKKELFISDPLYKNKELKIIYTDKICKKSKQIKIDLPTGPYLGSTKKVELDF